MDSTELRLILIGAGIILVIGIYAWEKSKRRRRSMREDLSGTSARFRLFGRRKGASRRPRRGAAPAHSGAAAAARREPLLESGDAGDAGLPDRQEPALEPAPPSHDESRDFAAASAHAAEVMRDDAPESLPEVLVVNVSARVGERFSGDAIMSAARDVGLVPGEMEILHRFDEDSGKVLFSMANMVQPGTFPFDAMSDFSTPGLALFAQLPAPRSPLEIYDALLETSERLAALLNGHLQDERRGPLTSEVQARTRERLARSGTL